jgi:hypothetical protein
MKHFIVALTLGVFFSSVPAHAQETPSVVFRFDSEATTASVVAVACSFDPTLLVDGRRRHFDVVVDSRRCSLGQAPDGAIPLVVRIEHVPQRQVVLETSTVEGVSRDLLLGALADMERELAARLQRPQFVAVTAPPETHERTSFSPGMMAGGILLIVGGSVGAVALLVGAIGNHDDPGAANILLWSSLASLSVGVGIGVPLLVVGHHKVDVTARLSPTGGALRVTF